MQPATLSREFILSFLKEAIPEYEEMLTFLEKNGGLVSFAPKIEQWLVNLNAKDYPVLYRGKDTLKKALLLAFMTSEEIAALNTEIENLADEQKTVRAEEFVASIMVHLTIAWVKDNLSPLTWLGGEQWKAKSCTGTCLGSMSRGR